MIGRDGRYLLALAFTSKDHDRDAEQEARAGRFWFDLGAGAWDPSGRPSEVRLDRVLRLDADAVRREGATLDRARFDGAGRGVPRCVRTGADARLGLRHADSARAGAPLVRLPVAPSAVPRVLEN